MTVPYGFGNGPIRRALAVLLGCAMLAGCVGVPKLGAPAAREAPSALATQRAFAAAPTSWPSDRWWEAYRDPQLSRLIDEALNDSPTLAEAQARLRSAEARAERAGANRGPTLTGNAQAELLKQSYNNGIPPQFVPHGWNDAGQITLNFSYDFDFWGRNRAALAAATSEARAASADAAEARLVLSTAIASAYAELTRLHAERDLAAEAVRVRAQSLGLVRQRVANGLDSLAAQRQAEAQVPQAEAALAAIDESIGLVRDQIAALAGAGPDRGLDIARPAAEELHPFGLPRNLAADLIGRRPDIVAARWRAEAATQRVGVAHAAFYPNINLNAFIGFQALGLVNLFKSGSDAGSVGPAISLPIFDAGRIRADYKGARADADAAVASYNGMLVQALREVADAATSERALGARLAESRQALAASEEAYRLAQLRYRGQLANYLTVLDAEDRVIAARRDVADLEGRAFSLDVALVRALGGGFAGS
ncbi:MAG TPA: efflux transporter outer membrane subunit [Allosphingosinicella sp.]|jgi:NodT family efflux transporter outer membrane factor (OMF) lipoprotein